MIRLILISLVAAIVGAFAVYLLAGNLPEGAIAGAVVGASIGIIIGARKSGASSVAFEFEAAGIPDDNLITIARRDLRRDAYRDSYDLMENDEGGVGRLAARSKPKPARDENNIAFHQRANDSSRQSEIKPS